MSQSITFDLSAAQDALARSDEGDDVLPGDAELIDALERWCQQSWDKFQAECEARDRAEWLARQCGGCVEGGTGEPCDNHWEGEE